MDFQMRAMTLWDLLDDIDTAMDMAKGNDAYFMRCVAELIQQRFNLADSDGHLLYWKENPSPVKRLNLDTGQVQLKS